jgi:hypothetical protein
MPVFLDQDNAHVQQLLAVTVLLHTPADAVLTVACQSQPAVGILRDQVWERRPHSELNGIVWVIEALEFTHPG